MVSDNGRGRRAARRRRLSCSVLLAVAGLVLLLLGLIVANGPLTWIEVVAVEVLRDGHCPCQPS